MTLDPRQADALQPNHRPAVTRAYQSDRASLNDTLTSHDHDEAEAPVPLDHRGRAPHHALDSNPLHISCIAPGLMEAIHSTAGGLLPHRPSERVLTSPSTNLSDNYNEARECTAKHRRCQHAEGEAL